jgi:PilZ domain.
MADIYRSENNKRKYFRVNFDIPLCTDMTISEIGGKKIKTGTSKVCVLDVGVGGLAFSSSLDFPIDNKVIFKFSAKIMGENITFLGNMVRRTTIRPGTYKYGVQFVVDEQSETTHIRLLNKLSIGLRKNWRNCEYSSCNKDKCPNRQGSK